MRPRWMFAAGALLALAAEPAAARLVREPAGPAPAATSPVETGGQRLGPGRALSPCSSPGAALAVVAWLSFQSADVIPCVLQPEQDYLQGAAAALRLAILQGRTTSWRGTRAFGSIRLLNSVLVGPGVTCRGFVHTLRLGARTAIGPGTACLRGGSWRIGPRP